MDPISPDLSLLTRWNDCIPNFPFTRHTWILNTNEKSHTLTHILYILRPPDKNASAPKRLSEKGKGCLVSAVFFLLNLSTQFTSIYTYSHLHFTWHITKQQQNTLSTRRSPFAPKWQESRKLLSNRASWSKHRRAQPQPGHLKPFAHVIRAEMIWRGGDSWNRAAAHWFYRGPYSAAH